MVYCLLGKHRHCLILVDIVDTVFNNIFYLPYLCLVAIYTCITIINIFTLCILDTREINPIQFSLYLTWYQRLGLFGIFFQSPLSLQLLSLLECQFQLATTRFWSPRPDDLHEPELPPSEQPHSLTRRSKSRFLLFPYGASPLLSCNDHLCRHHLVILFLDLVSLIQPDLFSVLGFFLSLRPWRLPLPPILKPLLPPVCLTYQSLLTMPMCTCPLIN